MQSWDFTIETTGLKVALVLPLFALALAAMVAQAFNPFLYFQF